MLNKHFIRSTDRDEKYSFGPKISLKSFNLNETVTLMISEFITPTIFFAYESSTDCTLDKHINLLYDTLSGPMRFTSLPQIGTACVGKFSIDNRWYRARVVDRNNHKMTVDLFFLDYGNIERNVSLDKIRKLEGTVSTQFSSFMDCSKLGSQGALFGFIGAMVGDNSEPWAGAVKALEMKRFFDFQIMNVPQIKYNTKSYHNTNVPFYLVRNNIFNKDVFTNYESYLVKELKWEKCNVEDSIQFLTRSFKIRQQHFRNIQLLLPNLLQEYDTDINRAHESMHGSEDDDNGEEYLTPMGSEANDSDNDGNKSLISSINGKRRRDDDDILIVNDEDCEIKEGDKTCDENADKDDDREDDNDSCSIAMWKVTSIMIKSLTESLQWHLPLPEEPTLKAIITAFNEQLEFHVNICSEDVTNTFKDMEKQLLKHFILCNDSMLKHYVTSNQEFVRGTLCLCSYRSTYIRCVILSNSFDDVTCRLIDFGDEVVLPKSDLIPISDQFCRVPPLAIKCVLSGLDNGSRDIKMLRQQFHEIIEAAHYEVLLSMCLMDKMAHFVREGDKIIVDQPIPFEVFIVQSTEDGESNVVSVNTMLLKMLNGNSLPVIGEQSESCTVENDPDCVNRDHLVDVDDMNDDSDQASGMKDIFINENLHHQTDMRFQDNKRPVCEYYRAKGRCFKGSKCQDRHVIDSDQSDDDSEDWKMMEHMHYLDETFERELITGSLIGLRVSCIYTAGVFYGYLTHDIHGFIDDGLTYFDDDEDGEDGLEFKSIQEMEIHLREFLKFQQVNVDKCFDLPVNTLVAVCEGDLVHRGSIRRMVSATRYQIFLVDYGVPVEANVVSLSLLPKKYLAKFKQQCFMCKLNGVSVPEHLSDKFANWFFDKVNRKVLHCKVLSTDQEGINYVELYNFTESSDSSLNCEAKRMLAQSP